MGIIVRFEPNIQFVKYLLSTALLLLFSFGFTQNNQSEYLEAKRQFGLGNYGAAKLGFQALTADRDFGDYASFYYALSSFKESDIQEAYDMWRQLLTKNPTWHQTQEVNYWLVKSSFALQRYSSAFRYLNELPDDLQISALQETLGKMSYSELVDAYRLNTDNEELATYLANEIIKLPYSQRDRQLLSELSGKLDAEVTLAEVDLPVVKKDTYAVAVVLPFMFESFETPQTVLKNSIIWDLYNGMKVAEDELDDSGINLKLFPFDTKKRGDVSHRMVSSGKLDGADLIIGPLYSQPNQVISKYAADQKVSMVNPLSSNGSITGDNPYSYLFKPSYETQGRAAANYAASRIKDNKLAFIFYETDRDSLLAQAYLDEIQLDSFFVVRFERLTNESAQQVQKDFIEKYEIRLDTAFSREEMDSIGLIPGRLVKSRPLRNEKTGNIIKDEEGEDVLEYYEERFQVKEDSIGHILVASSSNLLANNFISLSEVRNDTIEIIGYKDWLEFSTVSYNQLERLGIAFISPDLFDKSSSTYKLLEESFISKIGREPGEYHLIGYELVYQLGQQLDSHGKYFQRGLLGSEVSPGRVMNGLNYGTYHDNQVVPITKLDELRLVIQEEKEERTSEQD